MLKDALIILSPVARRLPAYTRLAWALVRDRRLRRTHRALVLGGVAYLLSPIDLIPGIIPVLGQIDDLAVTLLSLRTVLRRLPQPLADEHLVSTGLSLQVIDEDLRTLTRSGTLLTRSILRYGWSAAGGAARAVSRIGRLLLKRRSG